jgi:phosphate transport system substrate-binding protein
VSISVFILEHQPMRRATFRLFFVLQLTALTSVPCHAADALHGAGSSAAAPVYRVWGGEYEKVSSEPLNYEPIGSGAGMARMRERKVDFGASDVLLPKAELEKAGLVMFPVVVTGIVPIVNLPGVSKTPLRLKGDVLARIMLGEITQWNSSEIATLNPRLTLPNLPIHVVCRSDKSGSTYHFTEYLAQVSPTWKAKFGVSDKPSWPDNFLAVKGSGEVSKTVSATPGTIGYIDFNYVVEDDLSGVQLQNLAGNFVTASEEGFRNAVVKSAWFSTGDFSVPLSNLEGANTWPITMGTYVAVPKVAASGDKTARVLRWITWGFLRGDSLAKQAKFVPLPDKVQATAFKIITSVVDEKGNLIGAAALGPLISH